MQKKTLSWIANLRTGRRLRNVKCCNYKNFNQPLSTVQQIPKQQINKSSDALVLPSTRARHTINKFQRLVGTTTTATKQQVAAKQTMTT